MIKRFDKQTQKLTKECLVSREEAAEILGMSSGTLAVWSCTKRHPLKYVKVGRLVRYRISDIEEFLNNNTYLSEVKNEK